MGVKVGDKVIWPLCLQAPSKIDGQELLIMAETEIFGVPKPADTGLKTL